MGHMDYSGFWARMRLAGHTTYTLGKSGILGSATLQSIREGRPISGSVIERLCEVFACQPGDLMRYVCNAEEAAAEAGEGGERDV